MRITRLFAAAGLASLLVAPVALQAQSGNGASITPYAGYLVTGNWYEGPLGTNISASNAPMLGLAGSLPIAHRVALTGSAAYASGDLRVGLPIIGGINLGKATSYLYDAGVELGGLNTRATGIAPFLQAGIGGITNEIKKGALSTRATNLAYSAGVGIDVGVTGGFGLRVQAKDWIGKFDSKEAIGFNTDSKLTHNWALTAGVRFSF